jgi:hypothetical protein
LLLVEVCSLRWARGAAIDNLEHFTLEMLYKVLPAKPCRQIVAGELCSPLNNYLKR